MIKHLSSQKDLTVLLTTNTSQGMEILEKIRKETYESSSSKLTINTAYFPFDKPHFMDKAVRIIQPSLIVLMESELWPGLMKSCKTSNIKLLVANGRMTAKSLSHYMLWPSFWRDLKPTRVFAMSEDDTSRFSTLFGSKKVATMNNIKFDRIRETGQENMKDNPLHSFFSPGAPFIVLGSTRKEEEAVIIKMICDIVQKNSSAIIGLFPRHMHRLPSWKKLLSDHSLNWQLRSEIAKKVKPGEIILWDKMGELSPAYALARAVFIGGSLAPLGGQNFLEPLSYGIKPVIGPHWSNFSWVGSDIFDQQLVIMAKDWQEVSDLLLDNLTQDSSREKTYQALMRYVQNRQGGTAQICKEMLKLLN